jgi:uncharacterized membrane protein
LARWVWSAGLGLLGLAISLYLTATHYFASQVPLACVTGGIVDCAQVTTSAESMLGPLPVAVLGVVWFLGFLAVCVAHARWPDARGAVALVAWATIGLVVVFGLIYTELFLIGAICLWCTVVHALVIALFLLALADATSVPPVST